MRDGVRHGVFVLRSPLFGNGIPDLATEIVMMVFAVAVVMVAFMAVVAVWASVVIIAHRCVQFSLGAFEEVWVCIVGEKGTGGYVAMCTRAQMDDEAGEATRRLRQRVW